MDEKASLIDKEMMLMTPPANNDQSSMQGLANDGNLLDNSQDAEEIVDNTVYKWDVYSDFKIPTDSDSDTRILTDIAEINKITKYYTKYLIFDKKPASEDQNLDGLINMKNHQKLFDENTFNWHIALLDMDDILILAKETISKFSSIFDFEMLDHQLFQKLFPLKIINQYLSIVNREYGKPVYDKALRFQTNLLEIFMWHHFRADTRFHPKIPTYDINLMDPFLRIRIRKENSNDKNLINKYLNPAFDIKKFVFKMLDLYFPNVTWRYIGAGQEMHRWSLLLMLNMFEAGLYQADEMQELVNILLQKLENLLVLEKRSYKDFDTSLKGYPQFNKKLKAYFYECKEIVAGICIHIVILLNDQAFKDGYPLFNKTLKVSESPKYDDVWNKAYFSNSSIANILNRIMTTYLFQFTEKIEQNKRDKLFQYLNDFVMLTMDIANDVISVSAKLVTQTMIDFYHSEPLYAESQKADQLKDSLVAMVDAINYVNLNRKKEYTESLVLNTLKEFLVALALYPEGQKKNYFRDMLGCRCVPSVILSLYNSIITNEFSPNVEAICGLALTEACRGSIISQMFATSEHAMAHWQKIFDARRLSAVILQTSLFGGDYHLFYNHRSTMKKFLHYFKLCIQKEWLLKDADTNTHILWFKKFKNEYLVETKDIKLDELITFYIYCRFLCELITNNDMSYENKFHNLEIQDIIGETFFGLFFNILTDKDFLLGSGPEWDLPKNEDAQDDGAKVNEVIDRPNSTPESEQGVNKVKVEIGSTSYKITTLLESSSTQEIAHFVHRNSSAQGVQEHELRSAVFEVAMLTMKLLNRACSGLYGYWIYKYHAKAKAATILEKTEYMFDIPVHGLKYRAEVLKFYNNFMIFPNNSVMTSRDTEFKPAGSIGEQRVPLNLRNGTITNQIIGELNLVNKVEKFLNDSDGKQLEEIKYYFYNGLIPVIFKYIKGVYTMYSQDPDLETLKKSLVDLKACLVTIAPTYKNRFEISFDFLESEMDGGVNTMLNQVSPTIESSHKRKRMQDEEERLFPNLVIARDLCEEILNCMNNCLTSDSSDMTSKIQNFLSIKYSRQSVIYASRADLEPWTTNRFDHQSSISKLTDSQARSSMNLATVLVETTGLKSSKMRYYVALMEMYEIKKDFYLGKPIDENIFLKFLESGEEYTPNMIIFLGRLVERFFIDLIENKVDANSEESFKNLDKLLRVFLQNEILFSFITFFSKVLADCSSIRNSLYKSLMEEGEKNISKSMLSLFYTIMKLTCQLSICKTFNDYEHNLITERFLRLTDFMKNTCENNCQDFKILLGTFAPQLNGIPALNVSKKCMFFDSYVMLETMCQNFNVFKNLGSSLELTDRPEIFNVIINCIKYVAEVANGPCPQNQKMIYIYRTDYYAGMINRDVDNIFSSLYPLKNMICDYIAALTEGNDQMILHHYASNFTFDTLFDLICKSIKRIFIYYKLKGSQKKYQELAIKAREHKRAKDQKKKQEEESIEESQRVEMEYYLMKGNKDETNTATVFKIGGDSKESKEKELFTDDISLITQEIVDYVTVDDYDAIMDLYKQDDGFSSHLLLQIVFKLNDFLMRFADSVAGYKICLEDVYRNMADIYDDEVPFYIRNKLGKYEPKAVEKINEKYALYMFLCKITEEVRMLNPETQETVNVFFPLMPKIFFLTDQTKNEFMDQADTSSMMVDLIQRFPCFQVEMNDNLSLYRKYSFIYLLTSDDAFFYIKILLWILGMTLNLVLIIFYRREANSSYIMTPGNLILYIISGLIIAIAFCSLIIWFISRYFQKVKISKLQNSEKNQAMRPNKVYEALDLYIYQNIILKVYPCLFMFHIACCLLGMFVEPIFYTPQVLTIIFLSQTMGYVVQAITLHIDQLIQTLVLMLLVMYCYSMLAAEYFFDLFSSNQPDKRYDNCSQLWECLLFVFNNGLRMGGGIGDVTEAIDPNQESGRYVSKFFFDVAFFMLINVISLNIIFGIIIDTFAGMRETNDERGKLISCRNVIV